MKPILGCLKNLERGSVVTNLIEFLQYQLNRATEAGDVVIFKVKIDGLRVDKPFTVLDANGRVGDFNLQDYKDYDCSCGDPEC